MDITICILKILRSSVCNIFAVKKKNKNHIIESLQRIRSGFFSACKLLHVVNLVLVELIKFLSPQLEI